MSNSSAVWMPASIVGSHTYLHGSAFTKPEILINHVSTREQCTFMYNLDCCSYCDQMIFLVCVWKDNCVCLEESRVIVWFILQIFLTFPPPEEKSLEGGQLHLDVQYSTLQEACPSVFSSWVTVGDLRGDQGGLRLQVLRPWMSGAASLCCLKFWQLCQQTIQAH